METRSDISVRTTVNRRVSVSGVSLPATVTSFSCNVLCACVRDLSFSRNGT